METNLSARLSLCWGLLCLVYLHRLQETAARGRWPPFISPLCHTHTHTHLCKGWARLQASAGKMDVWTKIEFHHWSDRRYLSDKLQIKGIVQLCLFTFFHDSWTEPACCTSKYGATASSRLAFSGSLSGSLQEVKICLFCADLKAVAERFFSPIFGQSYRRSMYYNFILNLMFNWPATHTIDWHESDVNGLLQLTQQTSKKAFQNPLNIITVFHATITVMWNLNCLRHPNATPQRNTGNSTMVLQWSDLIWPC